MKPQEITEKKLLELIENHDGSANLFELVKVKIVGKIIFGSSIRIRHELRFIGCDFESIEFSNAEINQPIKFHRCLIYEVVATNESKFSKPLVFHTCEIKRGILFKDSKFDHISLDTLKIDEGEIRFENSESGFIDCRHIPLLWNFTIRGGTFNDTVRLSGVKCSGSYTFVDATFKGGFWIWAGCAKTGVIFNNGIFEKDFRLEAVDLEKNLSIIGATFRGEMKVNFVSEATKDSKSEVIESTPPEEIYLINSKFENGFRYEGLMKPEHREVKKVEIICSQNLSGEISFTDIKAIGFKITGANYSSRIIVNNMEVGGLELVDFANYSNLQLHNIRPLFGKSSSWIIKRSILGNASFFNINFEEFGRLIFIDSQILNIIPINVTWSNTVYASRVTHSNGKLIHDKVKARENYRQLKLMMQKQGDTVKSLEFERKEWQAFRLSLKQSQKKWWKKFNDGFILTTNWSNDYGLNWIKPLLLLLVSTFIFYTLIVFCADPEVSIYYSYAEGDFTRFSNHIIGKFWMYFHFLNPVHNLRHFAESLQDNGWVMFWNVWMRLFAGYFIFQMVRAFRKYTR